MATDLPSRFWLVVDANTKAVLGEFDRAVKASNAAKEYVHQNIGKVAAVMEVGETYTSNAVVERTFLEFPKQGEEIAL